MKEKIKNIIFYFGAFYLITVPILMIISIICSTKSIELNDSIPEELYILKDKLSNFETNACTKSINDYINYYEYTTYNGNINIKEYYENLLSYSENYWNIYNSCNLTSEEIIKHDLHTLHLSHILDDTTVFYKYAFQYELKINDHITKKNMVPVIINSYAITKAKEINILENIIKIIEERNKENEQQ